MIENQDMQDRFLDKTVLNNTRPNRFHGDSIPEFARHNEPVRELGIVLGNCYIKWMEGTTKLEKAA